MVINFLLYTSFYHTSSAGAWTRQALGTCLVFAVCVMAIVACMTCDGLCCPQSLHANKHHARVICAVALPSGVARPAMGPSGRRELPNEKMITKFTKR